MKNLSIILTSALLTGIVACSSKKTISEESAADSTVINQSKKPVTVVTWNQLGVRETAGEKGKFLTTVYLNEEMTPASDTVSEVSGGKRVRYQKVTLSDGKTGWVRSDLIGVNVYAGAIANEAPIYKRPEEAAITTQKFHSRDYVVAKIFNPSAEWVEVTGKRAEDKWFTTGYIKQVQVYFTPLEANYAAITRRAREETNADMKAVLEQQLKDEGIFGSSIFWEGSISNNENSDDDGDKTLYGYYTLNGDASDVYGHGNDGTMTGVTGIENRSGLASGACHFDGSSFITIHTRKPTTLTFPFTVAAWFSLDADAINNPMQTIVSMGRSTEGTGFNFGYTVEQGQGKVFFGFIGAEVPVSVVHDINIAPNTWQHLAGTFDGTIIKLYLNGELIGQTPVSADDADAIKEQFDNTVQPLEIGRELASLGRYFYGDIDEVLIYKEVFDDNSIKILYSNGFEPGV